MKSRKSWTVPVWSAGICRTVSSWLFTISLFLFKIPRIWDGYFFPWTSEINPCRNTCRCCEVEQMLRHFHPALPACATVIAWWCMSSMLALTFPGVVFLWWWSSTAQASLRGPQSAVRGASATSPSTPASLTLVCCHHIQVIHSAVKTLSLTCKCVFGLLKTRRKPCGVWRTTCPMCCL